MKLSIVIPIYYKEDNLLPLYKDLKEKIIDVIDFDYEIIMVNLLRNFGSNVAILCDLEKWTGDCAVVKAAGLQESVELVLEMVNRWRNGYNVAL